MPSCRKPLDKFVLQIQAECMTYHPRQVHLSDMIALDTTWNIVHSHHERVSYHKLKQTEYDPCGIVQCTQSLKVLFLAERERELQGSNVEGQASHHMPKDILCLPVQGSGGKLPCHAKLLSQIESQPMCLSRFFFCPSQSVNRKSVTQRAPREVH